MSGREGQCFHFPDDLALLDELDLVAGTRQGMGPWASTKADRSERAWISEAARGMARARASAGGHPGKEAGNSSCPCQSRRGGQDRCVTPRDEEALGDEEGKGVQQSARPLE